MAAAAGEAGTWRDRMVRGQQLEMKNTLATTFGRKYKHVNRIERLIQCIKEAPCVKMREGLQPDITNAATHSASTWRGTTQPG